MNSRDEPTKPSPAFPATRWSLVGRAGDAQPVAIAEIVRGYAPALRAHLLQRVRGDVHRADDLLQGFLADKVLEQRLIGHADPTRGRFRTFLLAALDRYIIDVYRQDSALKRTPAGEVLDIDAQRDTLKGEHASPGDAFELAWAQEVLGEVLATFRQQCDQSNRPELWAVFEARYLRPSTDGVPPESHEALARRLRLESAQQAANLLITGKRMFTRIFQRVVLRYAGSTTEVKQEVADLWRIFATKRP